MALRRLRWIATTTNAFPPEHSGFCPRCCTLDSLADEVTTSEEAKYRGHYCILVLLDVRSVFDCLPHASILDALRDLGVCGLMFDYLESILSGRTLCVRSTMSGPDPVTAGVPQDRILCPFLFNLALAKLPDYIMACEVHVAIYVDNFTLFACGPGHHRAALLEFSRGSSTRLTHS
ncbi:uncharacterized protein LOC142765486 [Rhipicephalus microplus]|uniref:uncharacterized protein LOC142765463 n=1 Tax=Rhipicephalus microplus TaxID=6941 RepID=UPI003F6C4DD0